MTGEVPEGEYTVPIGSARVVKEGKDVTVVATAYMVHESLRAAERLAEQGIDVEVVDPRTLQPLDIGTIADSVRKTHRVLVVHEAVEFCGIGAEIASQITSEAFDYLDAPPARIGAPFSPVPYSPPLEKAWIPDSEQIERSVLGLLNR
jgi:pyruvate dehydrogenase E1 component beta subunit